jgi:hypothetical protein
VKEIPQEQPLRRPQHLRHIPVTVHMRIRVMRATTRRGARNIHLPSSVTEVGIGNHQISDCLTLSWAKTATSHEVKRPHRIATHQNTLLQPDLAGHLAGPAVAILHTQRCAHPVEGEHRPRALEVVPRQLHLSHRVHCVSCAHSTAQLSTLCHLPACLHRHQGQPSLFAGQSSLDASVT